MSNFYNTPILIHERGASQFLAEASQTGLAARFLNKHASTQEEQMQQQALVAQVMSAEAANKKALTSGSASQDSSRPYRIFNGVAIIPISGPLYHRPSYRYLSYVIIKKVLQIALLDEQVKGIFIDMDSPGGAVAGLFQLLSFLKEARQHKPIWTHANEFSASASFAISCESDRLVCASTSELGSVGAIIIHTEYTKWFERMGDNVTIIRSGKEKAKGSVYETLQKKTKEKYQRQLDLIREKFAAQVASGRGIKFDDVMATEADVFMGQEAKKIGFVDDIQDFDDTLEEFSEHVNKTRTLTNSIGTAMNNQEGLTEEAAQAQKSAAENSAQPKTQAAAPESGEQSPAQAAAVAIGASDFSARIKAIITSDEGKANTELANHYAFDTELTAEQAIASMRVAAKSAASSESDDPVANAMRSAAMVSADSTPAAARKVTVDAQAIYDARKVN